MSGNRRHPLLGRIAARLSGEVAATALEAYRRAGLHVYELGDRLAHRRLELLVQGIETWEAPLATQSAFLCGWNASALQVIGDQLLAADEQADPLTAGYVPTSLMDHALGVYGQVAGWVSLAQQADQSDVFELDVDVPAVLPRWPEPAPPDAAHEVASGLIEAARRLRREVEGSLSSAEEMMADGRRRTVARIAQVVAEAGTALDYADTLGPRCETVDVQIQARAAVERYHLAGQLLAWPELALRPLPKLQRVRWPRHDRPLTPPGHEGFDPWCLTAPRARTYFRATVEGHEALEALWAADPDPPRTLAIQAEINRALADGVIAYSTGHYDRCPWGAIYVAKRPLRISGIHLGPVEEFAFDVGPLDPDGVPRRFARRILRGPFRPSHRV